MMTLKEAVKKVRPLDEKAMEGAKQRWDSIAKPLHSLGELENCRDHRNTGCPCGKKSSSCHVCR